LGSPETPAGREGGAKIKGRAAMRRLKNTRSASSTAALAAAANAAILLMCLSRAATSRWQRPPVGSIALVLTVGKGVVGLRVTLASDTAEP